ncbi:MAG: hypothetical protein M1839_001715 [Geoglossum umbratile]|nr:MAG: hypothetical protein M1839_001715 [Geoglossum umbratile]
MSLWEEARNRFLEDLRKHGVDKQTIDRFLQDEATPDDVKRSCLSLQADSDRKYGQIEVAGKAIPAKWTARIVENISRFVAIGDIVMTGSLGAVGLAWFALKQVLNAVQNNYKLYSFFGQALTSITEMLVLIRTYDKLYAGPGKPDWQASGIVGDLFSQIRNVYVAILDFSYSVRKHIKGGKMAKVGRDIKDLFGADLPEFEGKMGTIQALKVKIIESSQGAFQEKTFDKLQDVTGTLTNFSGTLSFLSDAIKSSLQGTREMKQLLEENLKSSKFKSIYDLALQDFETNTKALNPLPDSRPTFEAHIKQLEEGTCEWILELDRYKDWRESEDSDILYVKGEAGSGKSVLLASIIRGLQSELSENPEYTIQYYFCDPIRAADDLVLSLSRVQKTLICQLYELSTHGEEDSLILQRCNEVFNNPKQKKAQSALPARGKDGGPAARSKKEEAGPDLTEAYDGLARALGKNVFLIIDAANCIVDADQDDFVSGLQDMVAREGLCVKVLLSCRPAGTIYKRLINDGVPEISMDINNAADIDSVVARGLDAIPGWSQSERDDARQRVLEKTGSIFKYVVQVALPFLRQPFPRPISNRLKELPTNMDETYTRFLGQLAPNYLGLLKVALTWTLLADVEVTVEEVMDDYAGAYLASDTMDDPTEYSDDGDSKLIAGQIRDAGGPFLDVMDNGAALVVSLKDPSGIRDFCYKAAVGGESEQEPCVEVCARCKAELDPSHALSLSPKTGHLAMAITCHQSEFQTLILLVRHLNSPLFQRRYLSLGLEPPEPGAEPDGQQDADDGASEDHSGDGLEASEDQGEDKGQHSGDERDGDSEQNEGGEQSESEGQGDDEHDADGDTSRDRTSPEIGPGACGSEKHGLNGEVGGQPAEEGDDDESQDSEDRSELGWAENQTKGKDEDEDEHGDESDWDDEHLRYEIRRWFFHVRQAECLWTLEERRDSEDWAVLLAELDKFMTKSPDAFNAWKQSQLSFDSDWEPLHVAAYFGLSSLAEHFRTEVEERKEKKEKGKMFVCDLGLYTRGSRYTGATGADAKVLTSTGFSPLHLAACSESPLDVLKLLLEHDPEPNFETAESAIPAFHYWFLNHGGCEGVQELLRHGASCSLMGEVGLNVMHYFATYGSDPKVLDLLLDNEEDPSNRASIDVEDSTGESPLHKLMARTNIPLELLKAFVKRGADVNAEDSMSERPLYEAAYYGEIDAIEVIIGGVHDVDDSNNWGRTALHAASWEGHMETVELLLKHGANPNKVDKHNRTPLFFACLGLPARMAPCEATAGLLLDKLLSDGCGIGEINAVTKRGRTPLREAAAHGFTKVVETILGMIGPNDTDTVNKVDTRKCRSALHCAALRGRPEIVELLLHHGADATLRDSTGKTALQLCNEKWAIMGTTPYETTLSALIDHESTAAAKNKDLLVTAAINGSVLILEKLLDSKADLNEPDQYGWTPLLLAQQFQRTEAVNFLTHRIAQIGLKPTRWTSTYPSDWLSVSPDGRRLSHPQGQRLCVLADHPVPAGLRKYYYEIIISEGPGDGDGDDPAQPMLAIGFCTSSAHLLKFPGWPNPDAPNSHSWAYHGDDGGFYGSASSREKGWAERFGPGNTVGCGVDCEEGVIFFTLDGVRITDVAFDDVRGRLFPVLGFQDRVAVETNFGDDLEGRPFLWVEKEDTGEEGDGEQDGEGDGE